MSTGRRVRSVASSTRTIICLCMLASVQLPIADAAPRSARHSPSAPAAAPATPPPPAAPSATADIDLGADVPAPHVAGERHLSYGRFGDVVIYRPTAAPTSVAIVLSGDNGWNGGAYALARHVVDQGALAIGVDLPRYRAAVNRPSGGCQYFGGDFEGLSHEVQRRERLPAYLQPVLVGYSSGATLAYAVMVQSPKGTYAGAISFGFCPDLDLAQEPCRGSGLESRPRRKAPGTRDFLPARGNATPWVVFHGEHDELCPLPATRGFVAATALGELQALPSAGHGFAVESQWLPQFRSVYARLAARAAPPAVSIADVHDLPLIEVRASAAPTAATRDLYAVLLTGDGGWAGIDQDVAGALAAQGIPVVALNTLKYFWNARTPEQAALDVGRVLDRYAAHFGRARALLVGYSFGADVLPFVYTRLAPAARARVATVNLLGLSDTAEFEFHVTDWLPGTGGAGRATLPEIAAMGDARVLCLYGSDDADGACHRLARPNVQAVALPGGHHFGGDYRALATRILEHAGVR